MNTLTTTPAPFTTKEVTKFAEEVFSSLDVSENTRQDYSYRIGLFLLFIKKQKYSMTPHTYLEYKRFLQNKKEYTVSTKNKYMVAAKAFLSQYCKMYGLPDITANVKSFSQTKTHKVDGLHDEDVKKVADTLAGLPPTPESLRIKSIVILLALQGLRQVEIVRLDVADIDFVNNTALVLGKGRDDKEIIDLHPETVKVLKSYIKANKIGDGALFYSRSNNNLNNRLTTRAVRQMVSELFALAGVEKTVHGLRHFFTTKLIETYKGDLLMVKEYTRHKTLAMLQVYNDRLKKKEDLPRYYKAFEGVEFK